MLDSNQNIPVSKRVTLTNTPKAGDLNHCCETIKKAKMDQSAAEGRQINGFSGFVADWRAKNIGKHTFGTTETRIRALILILVAIVILVIFNMICNGIDRMLLAEKLIEKQLGIDLIAEQTDRSIKKYNDWESAHEHYIDSVVISVELLDRVEMTYAAVFDENLQNLSARSPSYEGSPFEPNVFPEYVAAVKANERGNLVLPFTPPGREKRDMYLHFRWLPSDKVLPHRLLVVVAISRYTINTKVSMWVQIAANLLVIATFAVVLFAWRKRTIELLNRTLERTVQQRTAELEEQTVSAQKASMAKSDFLSNMSHEMRTPMNAIIGMTTIAKNSSDLNRKDYCLKKIEEASTHLLSVINDILDMSKIEAKKFELSNEQFDFEKLLQKVTNVVIFRVDEKHQNFTVHIDKNIPLRLLGDDQCITQVITNLMSNAIKFTPEGGSIRLNAHLLEEKDNICTIKIEVIDTGIGISPEQQARLFASFVQAESSTTRKFGGTGLGLAISRHIIEMMNGEIWIESELGKGSTFAFTFKVARVAGAFDGMREQGVNWTNVSILVVDDILDTREYFVDIMHRFGSQCDVAANSEEACERINRRGSYDIYFIGLGIKGMDAIELARRVNALEAEKAIVIMASIGEWNDIEDIARDAGVSKFLPKPLFPSNIADCVNECLGSSSVVRGDNEVNYRGLFKGHRIILAEDVEVNREIVLSLLELTELDIDIAENGLAAFDLFNKNPDAYEMIFMDVQMPEMDGYEATKKIRTLNVKKAREIPIIAMTANVFKDDIEKCIACGMNGHLGKPLNYDKLISKLCEYLFVNSHTLLQTDRKNVRL